MATLQAKRIKDALQKVRRVGRIEEAVNIAGCDLVLQNLDPDEFEASLRETQGLEDVAFANAYQMEQVCRAIIEIDGQDLREADLIEDEVPAGSFVLELVMPNKAAAEAVAAKLREQKLNATVMEVDPSVTKTVKFERARWLRDNILKTWGREALTVAWRKFSEVLIKADEKAKTGVHFLIPDETAEEKYRRLLNDMREAEDELPNDLIHKLLDDAGLLKKAHREELDAVDARMSKVQEDKPAEAQQSPAAPVQKPATPPQPTPAPVTHTPPGEPPEAVRQAMEARQPMNQTAAEVPTPPRGAVPVSAAPRVQVPAQIRQAAMQNTQGIASAQQEGSGITTRRAGRANEIAALEGQLDPSLADDQAQVAAPSRGAEVPELSHKGQGVDERGLKSIIDRPPVAGVNRKFQPR